MNDENRGEPAYKEAGPTIREVDPGREAVWYGKGAFGPNRMGLLDNNRELGLVYRMPPKRKQVWLGRWLGASAIPAAAGSLALIAFLGIGGDGSSWLGATVPGLVEAAPRLLTVAAPQPPHLPTNDLGLPSRRFSQGRVVPFTEEGVDSALSSARLAHPAPPALVAPGFDDRLDPAGETIASRGGPGSNEVKSGLAAQSSVTERYIPLPAPLPLPRHRPATEAGEGSAQTPSAGSIPPAGRS